MGTPAMVLLAMAAIAYLAQAFVAVATGRHLFGDGSWLLLKLLSENHVAHWSVNDWRDFFVSRIGAFIYTQYPTLLASRLGVHGLKLLSIVYGTTLFSFQPISLLLCYRFASDKRYLVFPLLSLFAGTMNSEGYIVSETHLMAALFWAALFGMLCRRELHRLDVAAMIVVSAPLILCYETMAAFGLVLVAACMHRLKVIAKRPAERRLTIVFAAWYGLGVLFGILAILFPRDPTQRAGFLKGLLFPLQYPHIAARVSCMVLLLCALIMLLPAVYKMMLDVLTTLGVVCSMMIPLFILVYPELTSLNQHIVARTMNATVPLLAAGAFLGVYFGFVHVERGKYQRLFVVVAILGICQSAWSMIASRQWSGMLTVLRSELKTNAGPVPLGASLLSRSAIDHLPMREMHAEWPLMSLSIVYAEGGKVQAILLPSTTAFWPFDPYIASALPRLQRFGIDYSPYLASLPQSAPYQPGPWISFANGGNATRYETGGWWNPELWGTWTAEQAALTIDLAGEAQPDMLMEAVAGALVNEKNPEIDVEVLVNEIPAGKWSFRFQSTASAEQMYRMILSRNALNKAFPPVIRFRVTGADSPASLGMSSDLRLLGMAVSRLRLLPR